MRTWEKSLGSRLEWRVCNRRCHGVTIFGLQARTKEDDLQRGRKMRTGECAEEPKGVSCLLSQLSDPHSLPVVSERCPSILSTQRLLFFRSLIRFSIMCTQNNFHKGGDSQFTEGSLFMLFGFHFSHDSRQKTWEVSAAAFYGQRSPGDDPPATQSLPGREAVFDPDPASPLPRPLDLEGVPPGKGTLAPRHNQKRCAAFLSTIRCFMGKWELRLIFNCHTFIPVTPASTGRAGHASDFENKAHREQRILPLIKLFEACTIMILF